MSGERIETAGELDDFLTEISEFDSSDPAIIRAPHPSSASLRPYILTEDESGWWSATSFLYEDEDAHDVNALDIPLPWTVAYRPDRDLIAEAEARGARSALLSAADEAFESGNIREFPYWLRSRAGQIGDDRG